MSTSTHTQIILFHAYTEVTFLWASLTLLPWLLQYGEVAWGGDSRHQAGVLTAILMPLPNRVTAAGNQASCWSGCFMHTFEVSAGRTLHREMPAFPTVMAGALTYISPDSALLGFLILLPNCRFPVPHRDVGFWQGSVNFFSGTWMKEEILKIRVFR